LSPGFAIDNMPTCGVVGAKLEIAEWNNFATSKREVFMYEYPGKNDSTK
jgi:hypothetical protein